jgi:peptide/nickel transport system permease protein
MTHLGWIRRRLGRSLRVRAAVLVLGLVALPALFAEFVAADHPIVAIGPSGVAVLPAVVADDGSAPSAAPPAEHYQGALAWWPLVRSGPRTPTAAGPDAPASRAHPLGTDGAGRDVLARLVYGARRALGLTLAVLILSLVLGGLLGALAGYRGGAYDELLARPVEFIESFPSIVVVAVVRAIAPDLSLWSLVLAITAVRWAEIARLVREEIVRLNAEPFVDAARALGCKRRHIVVRHILPHAWGPLVVSLMFSVGAIVLLEVAVSFLGLGLEGSWGVLIAEGLTARSSLTASVWAALALALTVGAAHLLADAMSETLDARVATTRRRRRWWRSAPVRPA